MSDKEKNIQKRNDSKRLGANIRAMRKAFGESQEALGVALSDALGPKTNFEKNTISSYETGTRMPNKDTISAIARHYMVSVDELMFSDLTDIGSICIDETAFCNNIEDILPLVTSDRAMQNEHFRKAYEIHKRFYDQLHRMNFGGIDVIEKCVNEYELAGEVDEQIEDVVAANTLALMYLFMMVTKSMAVIMKDRPAALLQIASRNMKTRELLENPDPDLEKDTNEVLREMSDPENEEAIIKLQITLKRSTQWSELADYYLALQYVWNIVNNDLTSELNHRIGAEMLKTLLSVENPYAAYFYIFTMKALGKESSQSVDDK